MPDSTTRAELGKIAIRLVAVDRSAAQATCQALKRWAGERKATPHVQRALVLAQELSDVLDKTKVGQ